MIYRDARELESRAAVAAAAAAAIHHDRDLEDHRARDRDFALQLAGPPIAHQADYPSNSRQVAAAIAASAHHSRATVEYINPPVAHSQAAAIASAQAQQNDVLSVQRAAAAQLAAAAAHHYRQSSPRAAAAVSSTDFYAAAAAAEMNQRSIALPPCDPLVELPTTISVKPRLVLIVARMFSVRSPSVGSMLVSPATRIVVRGSLAAGPSCSAKSSSISLVGSSTSLVSTARRSPEWSRPFLARPSASAACRSCLFCSASRSSWAFVASVHHV